MRDSNLAYLAGFFDGEGCATLHRTIKRGKKGRSYAPLIQVTQKGRYFPVLQCFEKRWGGYFKYDRRADVVQWQCCTAAAVHALRDMLPYLMVKREKAEIIVEMHSKKAARHHRGLTEAEAGYEEGISQRLKALTKRDSRIPVNPLGR